MPHPPRAEPLDLQSLRRMVRYDCLTGKLYWLNRPPDPRGNAQRWNGRWAGHEICGKDLGGYIRLKLHRDHYLGHRVAWALHYGEWPKQQIDHINGNRADNRPENLRVVDQSGNCRNIRIPNHNTSGVMGVGRVRNGWQARIKVMGRTISLGRYDTLEAATVARKEAEARYGFHPNHGQR